MFKVLSFRDSLKFTSLIALVSIIGDLGAFAMGGEEEGQTNGIANSTVKLAAKGVSDKEDTSTERKLNVLSTEEQKKESDDQVLSRLELLALEGDSSTVFNMLAGSPHTYPTKALAICKIAAERGIPMDLFIVGSAYYHTQDFAKALPYLMQAAAQDGQYVLFAMFSRGKAQYLIGMMHLKGEGVSKSPEEALKWFEKAKNNHHFEAQKMGLS